MEILHLIANQFSAAEWARGPSCVCRTLNQLTLPCISIDVRSSQLSCLACCVVLLVLCPTVRQSLRLHCTHVFGTLAVIQCTPAAVLQLDRVANNLSLNGLPDAYYDRQIISWAVPRMRPFFKKMHMCAGVGMLLVWEGGHLHMSVREFIAEGSCLLHIEVPMEDDDHLMQRADRRMIGMAFDFGRAFHGAKDIQWICPYGPYA